MKTLDLLNNSHKELIKLLVDTKDESVRDGLLDVLSDIEYAISNEMKRTGVVYID
jgi:hypothetical protein